MQVFDYTDYRRYLRDRVRLMPKGGRGVYRRLAVHLRMHTTAVSQVLSGKKELSLEQGCGVADFFGLNDLETDYLLGLISLQRSGTSALKRAAERRLGELRHKAQEVRNRIPAGKELGEPERAIFYSHWCYSAVRMLTGVVAFQKPEAIAQALGLTLARVRDVLSFLVSVGLCEESRGVFKITHARTHIEKGSPLSVRHHSNWRIKAIESYDRASDRELSFTAPLTLSKEDAERVRKRLMELISELAQIVDRSPSEELYCMNLDWFKPAQDC